jgi:hypothetical protein
VVAGGDVAALPAFMVQRPYIVMRTNVEHYSRTPTYLLLVLLLLRNHVHHMNCVMLAGWIVIAALNGRRWE